MIRRASIRAALTFFSLLLWLAAFSFAVAAFAVWLAGVVGTIAACAIIAAAFLILGLAIQVGLSISARSRARRSPIRPLVSGGETRMPEIGGVGALAVVGIAGFLLGRLVFRK